MKKKQKHRTTAQIIAEEKLKRLFSNLDSIELKDYAGKEVRLIQEKYDKRIKNNELSDKFVGWYNENKNNTFVAKRASNTEIKGMYEFEGVEIWIFNEYMIEEVI